MHWNTSFWSFFSTCEWKFMLFRFQTCERRIIKNLDYVGLYTWQVLSENSVWPPWYLAGIMGTTSCSYFHLTRVGVEKTRWLVVIGMAHRWFKKIRFSQTTTLITLLRCIEAKKCLWYSVNVPYIRSIIIFFKSAVRIQFISDCLSHSLAFHLMFLQQVSSSESQISLGLASSEMCDVMSVQNSTKHEAHLYLFSYIWQWKRCILLH